MFLFTNISYVNRFKKNFNDSLKLINCVKIGFDNS